MKTTYSMSLSYEGMDAEIDLQLDALATTYQAVAFDSGGGFDSRDFSAVFDDRDQAERFKAEAERLGMTVSQIEESEVTEGYE